MSGHHNNPTPASATFATHGMLVVGKQTVYLSHLPMFMFDPNRHPHNYQVLLEVTFEREDNGSDPQAAYVRDREASEETLYTLVPEKFSITKLVPPDIEHQRGAISPDPGLLTSFRANVFRGHFERGGTKILSDVLVKIQRVLYWSEFDPNAEALEELEYILFENRIKSFLAHRIVKPPDFDQILSIRFVNAFSHHGMPSPFGPEESTQVRNIVIPGRPNTPPSSRLKFRGGNVDFVGSGEDPRKLNISVEQEIYFEEGELRSPADVTFDQTPEEESAGF
jgi:hypothetical protein